MSRAASSGETPVQHVVRQATLRFRSRTPRKLADDAAQIAVAARGVIVQGEARSTDGATAAIEVQLRLSPPRLDATLRDFRRLGDVVDESSLGQDVTQELAELAARAITQRGQEARLLALLERPVLLRDPLEVEREITRVRGEIEQTRLRIADLQDRSSMASIRLIVQAVDEPAMRSAPAIAQLSQAVARAVQHATTMTGWLLMAAGYALPLALLVLAGRALGRRRSPARPPRPAERATVDARASRPSSISP